MFNLAANFTGSAWKNSTGRNTPLSTVFLHQPGLGAVNYLT